MQTILLVDDDRLFRWAIREALQEGGYRVLEAQDSRQAREHLPNGVDLALVDYRLPDGTGFRLAEGIRAAGLGCPVLIVTAQATDEGEVEARRVGATAYFAKPDDPFAIVDIVQAALHHD